jgi:hypothetical protein
MKKKLAVTLTALTIGLLGATANAQYAPAQPGARPNVVDKRRPIVRQPVFNAFPTSAVQGKALAITGRWLPANAVLAIGGARIRASYSGPNKLTFVVPADLAARTYNARLSWPGHAVTIGRIAIQARHNMDAPVINGIASQAILGSDLTITGRWLSKGAVLKLGGYTLAPKYASSTRLTFAVPAHLAAKRYNARLFMGRMIKNLGTIRLVAPMPVITSVPNRAVLGKNLVIYGRNLPAGAILKIGNKLAKARYATATRLTFVVPPHMYAGTHAMKLLMTTGNKNLGRIHLSAPYYKPVVRYAPTAATAGKTITITGAHLPANAVLKIGGYSLRARSATSSRLVFHVPARLRAGAYSMKLVTARETIALRRLQVYRPRMQRTNVWSFEGTWFWPGLYLSFSA